LVGGILLGCMEWIETSKIGSIHIRTGAFETTTQLIFCSSPTWHWKMKKMDLLGQYSG